MAKTKTIKLPDPATQGSFDWTEPDIDKVLTELGRRAMQGKFNPRTWEGEDFKIELSDGREHDIMPKYFGAVYGQWLKLVSGK